MAHDDETPRTTGWSSGPADRPAPSGSSSLPPELDPRGRLHARAEAGERADRSVGSQARPTRASRHTGGGALVGVALGARIVAALVALLIIVVGGFYWATYRNFTTDIKRVNVFGSGSKPTHDIDGTAQNILIAGNDDRSTATPSELAELGTTEDGGSINTDTMMVLHLPADGSKAFAISFPRDTWVDIPGHDPAKLNAAYADGYNSVPSSSSHDAKVSAGATLLRQTIENLSGITIDHFAMVDLISFYRISNAIGGVRVCLLHSERPGTNGATGVGLDSGVEPDGTYIGSYTHINLSAGWNTISGLQALAFVRQRHGLPSDLDRIKRQQYFLSQAFRQISSKGTLLNPIKQTRLLKAISSSLTVDQTQGSHQGLDPLKLAQQMQGLAVGNLTFATIPVTNGTSPDGQDILVVDKSTLSAYVKKALGLTPPPAKPATNSAYANAKTVDPSTVTVTVLNGSGAGGVAGTNSQTLSGAGFKTGQPGNAQERSATTILYPAGMESQAKTLAQYVPGASVQATTTVQNVTLVLGTDGKSAERSPATTAPKPPTSTSAPAPKTSSSSSSGNAADQGGCIN